MEQFTTSEWILFGAAAIAMAVLGWGVLSKKAKKSTRHPGSSDGNGGGDGDSANPVVPRD